MHNNVNCTLHSPISLCKLDQQLALYRADQQLALYRADQQLALYRADQQLALYRAESIHVDANSLSGLTSPDLYTEVIASQTNRY